MSVRLGSAMMSFAAAMCASLFVLAQYQVNRQVYGGTYGPTPGSVRYAPQYLGATNYAPSSARMLPSEVKNYYSRSGATPSQMRTGYNAVGPMAPGGAASYLQPAPTYGRQAGPTGNQINTMASPSNAGSIRYANTTPANVGISTGAPKPQYSPGVYNSPLGVGANAGVGGSANPFSQSANPFSGTGSVRYNP